MSSSSATAADSRSPSPHTPDPSDPSNSVAIRTHLNTVPSWFLPMHQPKPDQQSWDADPSVFVQPRKLEDEQMLGIDDLLEQHAFDDGTSTHIPHSPTFPPQQQPQVQDTSPESQPNQFVPNFRPSNLLVPSRNGPISVTKPIPPPAPLPRKLDGVSHNQRVVQPPKEACFNLPIMFPSIPEGGTKSRVETQVRITVDLADANSSSDSQKYDRVGSWKWLKLPPGTSTKRRTRKQGKIDAVLQDTLNLTTEVVCASAPSVPVVSCSSCRTREAKRVAKKIAARVRPVRSDSESAGEDAFGKPIKKSAHEDTNSIIQFNCAEVLDFSTGSVVLPLRITCYCRHHREKVGFLVRFTMMDHVGRVVGAGISKPIMITDDHKTASASNRQADCVNTFSGADHDWSQMSPIGNEASPLDLRAPSRRKDKTLTSSAKKRPKPYDASAKPSRGSREGSVSSLPSPSTTYSPLPITRSPTPSSVLQNLLAVSEAVVQIQSQTQTPNIPSLQPSLQGSDSSSPDILCTPLDQSSDALMPAVAPQVEQSVASLSHLHSALQSPILQQPQPHVPSLVAQPAPAMLLSQASAAALPFYFFDPNRGGQNLALQMPTIHRLIPNMGPTYGGIEVTVLGANFHANLNLRCIFGDVVANSTHRWSDNTLVCMLPPRAQPGVVAVWFEGMLEQPGTPPCLFTYSDESDRALMELALQVVGLKMTGKIEDAKNVAMRIVGGNTGNDGSDSHGGTSNLMQLASPPTLNGSTAFNRDLRSLLFIRAGEAENFEKAVVDFLGVLDTPLEPRFAPSAISTADAISYPTPAGQTLLHLAAFMKLSALVNFLLNRGADIDVRDKNGFTPLHFAVLSASEECARVLVEAGADREVVNSAGKTAEEIAPPEFFDNIVPRFSAPFGDEYHGDSDDGRDGDVESEVSSDEDEETEWGDAGGESGKVHMKKRTSRHAMRRSAPPSAIALGRGTPRRALDVSRAATPPPLLPLSDKKVDKFEESMLPSSSEKVAMDAKQTASFVELIQRTFSQLPPATGIIPNLSYLPKPQLPGLPNLPEFSGVRWGALPQLPMVFPVFVPTAAWNSLFGKNDDSGSERSAETKSKAGAEVAEENKPPGPGEWKVFWEKWIAMMIATTAKQQQHQHGQQESIQGEDMPPPEYTPRAEEIPVNAGSQKKKGKEKAFVTPSSFPTTDAPQEIERKILREVPVTTSLTGSSRSHSHPVGYDNTPVPAEEVDAYTYRPPVKQKQRHQKRDRMLLLFWLPILLLSVAWAFHFAYGTFRTAMPLSAYLRGNV